MNAEQLKASILQQAIEGKLVPQLDSEGSVEQIGDAPEEVPFAIPEKWKWFTLGSSICQNIFPGLINTYGEINGVSSRPT